MSGKNKSIDACNFKNLKNKKLGLLNSYCNKFLLKFKLILKLLFISFGAWAIPLTMHRTKTVIN